MAAGDRAHEDRWRCPRASASPALGMGTWNMGDDPAARAEEIAALRLGLDLGLTLVDTAEMYGDGRAESLVGEALAGRRDEAFIVSKVYPHNASRRAHGALLRGEPAAPAHRPHRPLPAALARRRAAGRDGRGVRGAAARRQDPALGREQPRPGRPARARRACRAAAAAATDQVLYNLGCRGIEFDLLPWLRERGVPVMAYSPVEQGAAAAPRRARRASRAATA